MELTKEQLEFLIMLSSGKSLRHDFLGDKINHLYPEQEKDVEAKRQCEQMTEEKYLLYNGFDYKIDDRGREELRKRNLLR